MAFRGRLVQIGQSAGGEATLASADIRFKELEILGHTNFASPPEVRAAALRAMWEHAAAGRLSVPCETYALDDIATAWERQSQSPGVKLVIVPGVGLRHGTLRVVGGSDARDPRVHPVGRGGELLRNPDPPGGRHDRQRPAHAGLQLDVRRGPG